MNKSILLFSLLTFLTVSVFAQTDSITATKVFGGYKFEHQGQLVKPKAMLQIMAENQEALVYMKKAKSSYDISMVIGFSGGFLIGWPIGTAIGGGDPNWILAGVGAGLLVALIPISNAANANALKAVEIYNSSQKSAYFHQGINLDFGITDNGIGMKLTF